MVLRPLERTGCGLYFRVHSGKLSLWGVSMMPKCPMCEMEVDDLQKHKDEAHPDA